MESMCVCVHMLTMSGHSHGYSIEIKVISSVGESGFEFLAQAVNSHVAL